MLKFLRKYNKFLLAGFGTLLLIVWLVPSAVTRFSRDAGASGATWATLGDGSRVSVGELQTLQRQVKVLDALGLPLLQQLGAKNDPSLWYLLVREATQAGLVGGVSDGEVVLQQVAGSTPPEQVLRSLCATSGLQPQAVLQTLAATQGVIRMIGIAGNAARLSDARLEAKAVEAMSGVSGDVVVISAARPLPTDDPAPTPERMQALLKEFAATEPGSGRGGIGYRQPARVTLEWLSVPVSVVRASLAEDPRLSGVELRKAFLRNPAAYGVPLTEANPSFDAFKDKVRERELERITAERMDEIAKFVVDQTQLGLRGLPRDGAYARLPEGGAGTTLDAMAASVGQQFRVGDVKVERLGPVTLREITSVPGLGSASTTRFGNQPMRAEEVIEQTRELKPEMVRGIVQVGVIGPPLRGMGSASGVPTDLYAFRVLEASPAHDASGIDEVSAQLMEDTARIMRFETLEARRGEIETQARAGLPALASAWGSQVESAPNIREADAAMLQYGLRIPTTLPGLKPDEALAKAIVVKAIALPADLASVPEADRIVVATSPANMALVACRIDQVFPLYREDYESMTTNARFRDTLTNDIRGSGLDKAFGLDELRRRHGFHLTRDDEETAEAPAPAAGKAG